VNRSRDFADQIEDVQRRVGKFETRIESTVWRETQSVEPGAMERGSPALAVKRVTLKDSIQRFLAVLARAAVRDTVTSETGFEKLRHLTKSSGQPH